MPVMLFTQEELEAAIADATAKERLRCLKIAARNRDCDIAKHHHAFRQAAGSIHDWIEDGTTVEQHDEQLRLARLEQ